MESKKLAYAEDVGHYWKTSKTTVDSWLTKTKKLITDVGGVIDEEAFASKGGMSAFMMSFVIAGQTYKIMWPVLESRSGDAASAKKQAATMMYHDVKARVMTAKVMGAKFAFHQYMLLPDGRTAAQYSAGEFLSAVPALLLPSEVDVIEG